MMRDGDASQVVESQRQRVARWRQARQALGRRSAEFGEEAGRRGLGWLLVMINWTVSRQVEADNEAKSWKLRIDCGKDVDAASRNVQHTKRSPPMGLFGSKASKSRAGENGGPGWEYGRSTIFPPPRSVAVGLPRMFGCVWDLWVGMTRYCQNGEW